MWISKPKYPVKQQLIDIKDHRMLPSGASEIGRIVDKLDSGNTFIFVKNGRFLTILKTKSKRLKDGNERYTCFQVDLPMGFLSWFAGALSDFQKPPAEGGLPTGVMVSHDQEINGEMLCLQRAMGAGGGQGGYAVLNRSRCKRGYDPITEFEPHRVSWADNVLFEGGLLALIKDLGKKYQEGKL